MEYISFVKASRPRFKTQSYYSPALPYSPALSGAEFSTSNAGLQGLTTDKVQFGAINRAQKSRAAKRENINRGKDKKREAIRSIEESITALYDQNLQTQDKKAFQIKIMGILEAHPELSMNTSLRFDLKNRKLPAIPLLHFALAQKYFGLAEYILRRDAQKDEIDYTQTDFRGKTAAQIAQLVFEDSQEYGSDDPDENMEVCEEYAKRIMLKSYKYEQLHPEKRINTITNLDEKPSSSSSPILLKNFSHRSWKQFLKEELGRDDVSSDEDSPDESIAGGNQAVGSRDNTNKVSGKPAISSNGTAKEKKQPKFNRRQQVEQAEKKKKQDEIDRKNNEQTERAAKLESTARLSVERQKLEEKRMAAINKAWDLNARLEAIPKMQLCLEWKPEVTEDAKLPETLETVKADGKSVLPAFSETQPDKQEMQQTDRHTEPPQPVSQNMAQQELQPGKAEAFKTAGLRPASLSSSKKIVPAIPRLQPGHSVTNKQSPETTSSSQASQSLPEEKAPQDKPHTMSGTDAKPMLQNAFMSESKGKGIFTSPTPLTPITDDEELITTSINQFSLDESDTELGKEHGKAKIGLPPMPKNSSQYSRSTDFSLPKSSRTFSQSSRTTNITQPSVAGSISTNGSSRKSRNRSSKIAALKRNLEEKQQLLNQASVFSLQNQQASFSERQELLDKAIHDYGLARQEYFNSQKLQWEKQQVESERDNARSETAFWQNEAQHRSMAWANYTAIMQDELNALRAAFNAKRQGIFQEQMHVLTHPNMSPGFYAQQWDGSMNAGFCDSQWAESLNAQEQAIHGLENLQMQIQEQEAEIAKNYIPCQGGSDGNTYGYRVKEPCGKRGVWPGSWVPDR